MPSQLRENRKDSRVCRPRRSRPSARRPGIRNGLVQLTCLLLLAWARTAGAQSENLYEIEVPVRSREPMEQRRATDTALRLVLVKITGDQNAAQREEVAELIKNAEGFVQQYSYREGSAALTLWIRFDPKALREAVAGAGLELHDERPKVLVWMGVEEDGRLRVLKGDDPSGHVQALRNRAAARGLALVFPDIDLGDEAWRDSIAPQSPMSEPIAAAARHYGTSGVLALRVTPLAASLWQAEWTLFAGGEAQSWATQGDLPDLAIEEGVDRATDLLFQRSLPATGLQEIRLEVLVEGIARFEQVTHVEQYLRALKPVSQVALLRVEPERAVFSVTARGGAAALDQAVAKGRTLLALNPGIEPGRYQLLAE
ncbi:MAG: DUF2066 domain-containing protein [Gammaproteobacteria bacterium]